MPLNRMRGVGVERDVGDGVMAADKMSAFLRQMVFHNVEEFSCDRMGASEIVLGIEDTDEARVGRSREQRFRRR